MSNDGRNVGAEPEETAGIWFSAREVNALTEMVVELPYKVAAPIVQFLGHKLMEQRKNDGTQ